MSRTVVHVLSDGFQAPNARALVYPLIVHRRALRACGLDVRVFAQAEGEFADCDVLIVDSKHFHGPERGQLDFVCASLGRFAPMCSALAWYDSTDSAGWVVGDLLPLVRRYFKNQLLRDRTAYLRPMYGRRAYTEFYHHMAGVSDDNPQDAPQVPAPDLLGKLSLGWNSGLADYSRFGPARMALYAGLPLDMLLGRPRRAARPNSPRRNPLSCRMGLSYERDTVSYQRRVLHERLGDRIRSDKLRRGGYFAELRNSRAVLSPFGLGEITLKDFEVFLTGGLLVKPDMSHLETWPDLYVDGETMLSFRWDLEDLDAVLGRIESDPATAQAIAAQGQDTYMRHVTGDAAANLFADHFANMVTEAAG